MKTLGGFLVLAIRGVLLWVLIPVVGVGWLLGNPIARLLGHGVTFGQALGWADLNMTAALQRGLPGAFVPRRRAFVSWREMGGVSHRIGLVDPA